MMYEHDVDIYQRVQVLPGTSYNSSTSGATRTHQENVYTCIVRRVPSTATIAACVGPGTPHSSRDARIFRVTCEVREVRVQHTEHGKQHRKLEPLTQHNSSIFQHFFCLGLLHPVAFGFPPRAQGTAPNQHTGAVEAIAYIARVSISICLLTGYSRS